MTPMRPFPNDARPDDAQPRRPGRRRTLAGLGAIGLMAGCGGGTDVAGVGSGGTGAPTPVFASGPISGFGSVIVNGIRFDDRNAAVLDDLGRARTLAELGLGMVVEIEGTADERAGVGTASSIRIVSIAAGLVESIDAASGRFVVLGTVVSVDGTTVWNDAAEIRALRAGGPVEVWGFVDAGGSVLKATRVEIKAAPDAVAKLRGTVTEVDRGRGLLRVGTQLVDASAAVALASSVAIGSQVVVSGTAPAPGQALGARQIVAVADTITAAVAEARIDGVVTRFESGARFEVGGLRIDASGSAFADGVPADLRVGTRVTVVGEVRGGVVVARTVAFRVRGGGAASAAGGSDGDGNGNGNANANANTNASGNANANGNASPSTNAGAGQAGPGNGGTGGSNANGNAPNSGNANAPGSGNANAPGSGNANAPGSGNANAPNNGNGSGNATTPSRPGGAPPSVEDDAQITGVVTADSTGLANLVIVDTTGRRFTVDARGARVVGGNVSSIVTGAIVIVEGTRGTLITASSVRLVR